LETTDSREGDDSKEVIEGGGIVRSLCEPVALLIVFLACVLVTRLGPVTGLMADFTVTDLRGGAM